MIWGSRGGAGANRSGLLVHGVKEPLCELPELSRSRLALLLQPHVVLSQVLNLLLQHGLILLLLNTHTHTHTISTGAGGNNERRRLMKALLV